MAHGICEDGICEELWMKIILDDLKVKYEGPMKLFCDNNLAISIVHNPVQHDRNQWTLRQREIGWRAYYYNIYTYKDPSGI
ncbi:hypothetical protein CR513_21415, partial [Mucuna pruriens]